MKSHTHQCPHCDEMFRCSAELIENHDGWPERLCGAEVGDGYQLVKPLCEDCHDNAGDAQSQAKLEA